jgi:hypothetical protein
MLRVFAGLLLSGLWLTPVRAQTPLDLSRAVVFTPSGASTPERKAAQALVEEIESRTRIRLKTSTTWPAGTAPVIAVGRGSTLAKAGRVPTGPAAASAPPEGFEVRVEAGTRPVVWVRGNDPRGTVFAAGYLLRNLRMTRDGVTVPADLRAREAPKTPMRGHQLGYRAKTNSYDGWDLRQWEQYIRELALFGTNAIELLPPQTDDVVDSPHAPQPPLETMIGQARIAAEYGLDVWVWYPALEEDYTRPATLRKALAEWDAVLSRLPRLDAVLVPCGDPGHTPPEVLFPMLEKQAAQLKRRHPKATWWVAPQGFSAERMATFTRLINENPPWLTGVAYGPWMRMNVADFRAGVPARYPVRLYPDITHSHRAQYPVPDWDYAFVITQHREPINPRPVDMAAVFRYAQPHTVGFIAYSEGCNDDVNKMLWSALAWNPDRPLRDILREYARTFIGPDVEEAFAEALFALEQNWRGPISENVGIDSTLAHFQRLEKTAPPPRLLNWRFQQALFRAYYDAYLRQRHRQEQDLERQALTVLADPRQLGSAAAIQRAREVLAQVETAPVAMPLRTRLLELGEALFQSIRMQLYLGRHHQAARSDGATLERLDTPLNNRPYLLTQFERITALPTESERLAELRNLAVGTPLGPGDFYDDLGNPARQPHLLREASYAEDPDFLRTPLAINEQRAPNKERYPLAWHSHVMGLYDQPIRLRYTGLDPQARYRVRVVYAGGPVRLVANEGIEIHPYLRKEWQTLDFDLPAEATRAGTLTLAWTKPPGEGESGRGNQVSEVWLLKQGNER